MKTKMVYEWKQASAVFSKADATSVFGELQAIREQNGGLTPAMVVERARDESSAMHALFPWDDAEAARVGRELIASKMIRSIRVTIVSARGKPIATNAFVSRPDPSNKGKRSYVATTEAMDDEEGRALILRQAWAELHAWRRRFSELQELAQIFDVIDREHSAKAV